MFLLTLGQKSEASKEAKQILEPEIPAGPADGSACACKMILIKGGSCCYINAFVRCWVWNVRLFQDVEAVGDPQRLYLKCSSQCPRKLMASFKTPSSCSVLYTNWPRPEEKHDICEYAHSFLSQVKPRLFLGSWQSMRFVDQTIEFVARAILISQDPCPCQVMKACCKMLSKHGINRTPCMLGSAVGTLSTNYGRNPEAATTSTTCESGCPLLQRTSLHCK